MNKMNLYKIFELQKKLQSLHGHNFETMDIQAKEQYTKDMVLYLLEETHELLRETNFKTYKKVRKPIVKEKIEEELIDMLCFYTNLCIVWDVNVDDLMRVYEKKNQINIERVTSTEY